MLNNEFVARLSPELAAPLALVLQERCTYRDVAARLGLPADEVATRLRAALRQLSEMVSPTATPPTALTEA